MQSGADITQSNTICYCTQHNGKWSKTYIRVNINPHPKYRIYASVNRVSIGSDNCMLPIRRQAII